MAELLYLVIYEGALLYIGDARHTAEKIAGRFGIEVVELTKRSDTLFDFSRRINARKKDTYVDSIYRKRGKR